VFNNVGTAYLGTGILPANDPAAICCDNVHGAHGGGTRFVTVSLSRP